MGQNWLGGRGGTTLAAAAGDAAFRLGSCGVVCALSVPEIFFML